MYQKLFKCDEVFTDHSVCKIANTLIPQHYASDLANILPGSNRIH